MNLHSLRTWFLIALMAVGCAVVGSFPVAHAQQVASDGKVKAVNIKGGHPVLAQAAAKAVQQWRWEPAGHDSKEDVDVKFAPE